MLSLFLNCTGLVDGCQVQKEIHPDQLKSRVHVEPSDRSAGMFKSLCLLGYATKNIILQFLPFSPSIFSE